MAAMSMAAILLSSPALAQSSGRVVSVVVHTLPPFVEQQNGKLTGFSIDLWNAIASRRNWTSVFQVAPDVQGQLNAISTDAADIGVGAISITAERDLKYDFSQPILNGGFQILVRSERPHPESTALINLLHLLLSPAVLVWLGIAGLLTVIPAHIVWFVERAHPDGIIGSKRYFPGIFQAFFWGLGTLATQADAMPRHWVSRVVAVLWMFTGVVFVAFYTATLTATLTLKQFKSEINGPADLPGKTVAAIDGSTSADYLKINGVEVVSFGTTDKAYEALMDEKVDAVVFDAPALQYIAAHNGAGHANIVGPIFHAEDYGFVFKNGGDLRKKVDATLLSMREDGTYDQLSNKWFGKK
ncbi:MAG: transporter substrate-binding domain-containing protein [Dongiaceae bacterium]